MQGLAQRVTVARPDLVNSDATFGELAWIWGKGHASDGETWRRRLWFSGDTLVAWGWAYLPHQVRRSDGSVKDVTGAYLGYQVHPGHGTLVAEVIRWYDAVAAGIERTVMPRVADEFALKRWAAHGYETDPASLGDIGSWTQLNERDLTAVEQPVLPGGFRFRTADEAGPKAAVQAHVDAWAPSTYTAEGYQGVRRTAAYRGDPRRREPPRPSAAAAARLAGSGLPRTVRRRRPGQAPVAIRHRLHHPPDHLLAARSRRGRRPGGDSPAAHLETPDRRPAASRLPLLTATMRTQESPSASAR